MSYPRLPREIQDAIIEELQGEKVILCKLSLVCKAWMARSRNILLLDKIDIVDATHQTILDIFDSQLATLHLAKATRIVVYVKREILDSGWFEVFIQRCFRLPQANCVIFLVPRLLISEGVKKLFGSVPAVHLDYTSSGKQASLHDLIEFIAQFDRLRTLWIRDFRELWHDHGLPLSSRTTLKPLHTIISPYGNSLASYTKLISSGLYPAHIHIMNIGSDVTLPNLNNILQICGTVLRHVTIYITLPIPKGAPDFSANSNLQSIMLILPQGDRTYQLVDSCLASVPKNCDVEQLAFGHFIESKTTSTALVNSRIAAMASKGLKSLRLYTALSSDLIASTFPKTAARQIIEVSVPSSESEWIDMSQRFADNL